MGRHRLQFLGRGRRPSDARGVRGGTVGQIDQHLALQGPTNSVDHSGTGIGRHRQDDDLGVAHGFGVAVDRAGPRVLGQSPCLLSIVRGHHNRVARPDRCRRQCPTHIAAPKIAMLMRVLLLMFAFRNMTLLSNDATVID